MEVLSHLRSVCQSCYEVRVPILYINTRRVNSNAADPNSRAIIRKAYEFALNHVGQDKDSGEIWKDYIDFLKGTEAHTTWDTQQRMDALRSAYHRAVVVPVENVELLWRDLDAFETNLNKITVRRVAPTVSLPMLLIANRRRSFLEICRRRI